MTLVKYFVTVPLGIEEITAKELRELGAQSVVTDVGKVFFEAPIEFIYIGNFMLRTINRLFILLLRSRFKDLNDIEKLAYSIDYTWIIPKNASFAVRTERIGSHNFTSIDVNRVVGSGIIKSYLRDTGVRLRVNLNKPDIEIYSLVRDDEIIMGVNTTGDSLHRRRYRVYNHPAALKTTLASAMVILSGYEGRRAILDPMCGGGTLVIEAIHKVRKYPIRLFRYDFAFRCLPIYDPETEEKVFDKLVSNINIDTGCAYCIDISPKHIEGARANALSGRVYDAIRFLVGDCTKHRTFKDVSNVECIVTNPPYGMRFHNIKKIHIFYKDFLSTVKDVLSGSKLVVITASHKAMDYAIDKVGVDVVKVLNVMHGGLMAKIYVLKL